MATLKAVVRMARTDGFYPVYIRVTHHRASSFIKTDKMVTKKELTKNNEIKDFQNLTPFLFNIPFLSSFYYLPSHKNHFFA